MSTSELDLGGDSVTENKAPEPPPTGRHPRSFRPLILRLHFYAGLLVGPFILIAAITGGLYAMAPTVERVVYGDILSVDPSGTALPLSAQAAAAQAAYPDLAMSGMRPAATESESTRVYFNDAGVGEEKVRAVFVDPYSGEVLGSEPTWFGYLPFSTWLDGFHRHLQLGESGRLYSEFAATWLWVVVVGFIPGRALRDSADASSSE
ncbi:PepSY-associated TM helix domain-containing protein [Aldersonia kunmingensis]|uniref:PepSY-associated TM helix domain-containing protein n=1 Tax=Aldersonia kunmingensis TaxID=408066 RepID=UPI000830BB31|nr:PepSY-associated TM helix domain-containing protein [Aldersonia kunmingensis]